MPCQSRLVNSTLLRFRARLYLQGRKRGGPSKRDQGFCLPAFCCSATITSPVNPNTGHTQNLNKKLTARPSTNYKLGTAGLYPEPYTRKHLQHHYKPHKLAVCLSGYGCGLLSPSVATTKDLQQDHTRLFTFALLLETRPYTAAAVYYLVNWTN